MTESNAPRRIAWLVISANQRSTWLSQGSDALQRVYTTVASRTGASIRSAEALAQSGLEERRLLACSSTPHRPLEILKLS
jgi:hypothetical protein